MTDTLRRFGFTVKPSDGSAEFVEMDNGPYVAAADVERVVGEYKKLSAEAIEAAKNIYALIDQNKQLQHALAAQEASLAQVQARIKELEGQQNG